MKLSKQYEELQRIREIVNGKLAKADFASISDLIRFMNKDEMFEKLRNKDTQLGIVYNLAGIWLEEKTRLNPYGIDKDIFEGVNNLDLAEEKYRAIEFGIFRIENDMPQELIDEYVDRMISERISGVAMALILKEESKNRADNVIKLSRLLKDRGDYVDALILLETASVAFYVNDEIFMELADTYIEANCLEKAYDTLMKIENKDNNIEDILGDLKAILSGEVNE